MDTSIEGKFNGVGYTTTLGGDRVNYVVFKMEDGLGKVVDFLGEIPPGMVPALMGKEAEFVETRGDNRLRQSLNIGTMDTDHYFGSVSLELSRAEALLHYPGNSGAELLSRPGAA
jgi:hypothetical protein